MLGSWIPHSDYVSNLLRNLHWHCIYCSERVFQMEKSILKLFHLNLDKSLSILAPLYSHTGSPSREQAGIIRSFVLMLNQGYSSIPNGLIRWLMTDSFMISVASAKKHHLPLHTTILSTACGTVPKNLKYAERKNSFMPAEASKEV
jgi:hypothetical protein